MQDNKITIVFEPLLSLMKNQLDYLRSLRIPAETINSLTSSTERNRIVGDLKAKTTETKFLYITPEQAATSSFSDLLSTLVKFKKVAYIVGEWPLSSLFVQHSSNSYYPYSRRSSLREVIFRSFLGVVISIPRML